MIHKIFYSVLLLFMFLAPEIINAQVSVAIGKHTPEINGSIEKFEYSFSGTGFFNLIGKTYAVVQSHYYLSYDDKNLYVAVASPIGKSPLVKQSRRDGNLWEDESVEVYLLTDKQTKYQFIINPEGVVYDSENGDVNWNLDALRVASKVKDGQWILEMAFPFDKLTSKTPAAGDSWKINICRSLKDNMVNTTLGPCNITYSDTENFISLKFASGIPQVDIESIGNLNNNILAFKMDMFSSSKNAVLLTLNSPKPVLPYQFEKRIELNPGKVEMIKTGTENLPPDNVLKINLKLADGTELYRAGFPYKNQSQLAVSYIYTDIAKQILQLVCSSNNKKLINEKNCFIIKMLDEKSKAVLDEKRWITPGNIIFTVPVNIAELPPGEYKLVIQCRGSNNEVLLNHWERYRKSPEKPEWADTKAGISGKVPAPWTPVSANNEQFKCWGRTYSFGSGLLSSIKSQGKELLAAPIRLSVDGREIKTMNVKLAGTDDSTADYRLEANTGKLKLNAKVKAEFDGFLWIDLDIMPLIKYAKISKMTLDIPLERSFITGFDNCQSNKTKVDLTVNSGKVIFNDFSRMPSCWIGGDDVGLMFGARNLKGWHVKHKDKSMEILQNEKTVTVRLNLVDVPFYLKNKRSIGFYLEATPAKPKNPAAAKLRADLNVLMWSSYWNKYYDYYQLKYIDSDRVGKLKNFEKYLKVFHYTSSHGTSPYSPDWNYYGKYWHSSPPALGAYCVDNDVSKRHLRDRNTFTYACLDCKSFFDFKLATLTDFINNPDIGIENLYIDLSWPKMCGNAEHGCAWTDEFGDKQSSFDVIGTREYYKRLYNVLKAKNPDAMIAMHIVRTRTPADSFADLLVCGEAYDRDVARLESYYDVLNPNAMRIMYASRNNEQTIWLIPQFTRGFLLFRPQRAKTWKSEQPEASRAVKHFIGYMTVHNISFWYGIDTLKQAKPFYAAQDWLGWDDEVVFLPYWKPLDNPVKLLNSQSDRIMVSAFARKGKVLLAALNDTDNTVNAEVRVDVSKLGLGSKMSENIIGRNSFADDSADYIIKNGKLNIPMGPREFKLLKFE